MVQEIKRVVIVDSDGTERTAYVLAAPPAWVFARASGRARVKRPSVVETTGEVLS